jgi:DNA repair protein RadA/Sms
VVPASHGGAGKLPDGFRIKEVQTVAEALDLLFGNGATASNITRLPTASRAAE